MNTYTGIMRKLVLFTLIAGAGSAPIFSQQ